MGKLEDKNDYLTVTFTDQDFSGLEIASKEFDGCTFTGCNFSEAIFKRCNFVDCEFVNCNLSNVELGYSKFSEVVYHESKLVGIDWTKAAWSNFAFAAPIKFYKSIVNDSSFYGLSFQDFVLEECKAHSVDFREGDFSNSSFTYTDLTSSLFSNTNLTSTDLSEATNYDIDVYRNEIKNTKFSRFEATRLLDSLEIELVD